MSGIRDCTAAAQSQAHLSADGAERPAAAALHRQSRRDALHDGRIITIRPNLRWTSDGFEIPCWNGEIVRVAFALDTCDREAMAWCATTDGISGEMIRDLMLESVEQRFGATSAPHAIAMALG